MKFNVGTTIYLVIFTVLLIEKIQENSALHLKGTFKTNEFFKFVTRFGFQKTDEHNVDITTGYIYGNISLVGDNVHTNQSIPTNSLITLAVMDYNYFIDYYNERMILPRSAACSIMFEKIEKIAYFYNCNEEGM